MYCECGFADGRLPLFFIINPASHSGRGMLLWRQAERILKREGVPYEAHFSEKPGELLQIAQNLTEVPDGEERFLIALGGDGTVNELLQGFRSFERVRLGYIPTGSSNDLARDMGIGKDLERTLMRLLKGGAEERLDVGCLSWTQDGRERKRSFLVSCGIGYDAAVCQEALCSRMKNTLNRLGLGKFTYLGIGLKQIAGIRYARTAIRLDGERTVHCRGLLFAAVMLHRFEGGGFCFCPQADAQDGLLDLCVVDRVPRWKFPLIIPFALRGRHYRFSGVEHYRAGRVEIKTSEPLWVQTDGEIPGKLDRIRISVEKQKLRFVY
ncbi:MAG: diacylglycerol kinase family lipid kinase [Eubacteriales bacterium]|nr:diacylglycerol kinase family lipid kinase [Eubacteriales bacterium]